MNKKGRNILLVFSIFIILMSSVSGFAQLTKGHKPKLAKPDLFIKSLLFGDVAWVGEKVQLKFLIMNRRGGRVAGPSNCIVKIGREAHGRKFTIPKLNPGKGYTFSREWTPTKKGNVNIIVIADFGGNVDEMDEDNTISKIVKVSVNNSLKVMNKTLKISGSLTNGIDCNNYAVMSMGLYLNYGSNPAENLIIKVNDHFAEETRPGIYEYRKICSIVNNIKILISKKLSTNPDNYQTLVSATGNFKPTIEIFSPLCGSMDVQATNGLKITWSVSPYIFDLIIREFITGEIGYIGNPMVYEVKGISGNSHNVPVSVLKPGKTYEIYLKYKIGKFNLFGKCTPGSTINYNAWNYVEFRTMKE